MGTLSTFNPIHRFFTLWLAVVLLATPLPAQTPAAIQATTVPLLLPAGLAYDRQGNLLFAESGNHLIRSLSPTGILTTFAGTGVQGFAGDNGPATAASLDSPSALVLDPAGNLFLADTHNHRIRRIDAVSHLITTIAGTGTPGQSPDQTPASAAKLDLPCALAFDAAGNLLFADARTHLIRRIDHATTLITTVAGDGTQGFHGDLGPALSASLDTPSGLALDPSGNLFLADTHNHRIRRVDHTTGIITTLAGTGQPRFSGDAAQASAASLALPRGLIVDPSGNLFVVDAGNQRIRRIDAVTGQIATIAGEGTQTFTGDLGIATAASLDAPQAIALSPNGLPIVADSANGRIRQLDAAAVIHTIAGLGATPSQASLTLSSASVVAYGAGSITASLAASPATGLITFFDRPAGSTLTLASVPLLGNIGTLATSTLSAGLHRLSATYAGDDTHPSAQSNALSLSISPAPVTAILNSQTLVYGQPVAALAGTFSGVLAQDTSTVSLNLTSTAGTLSPPAVYPILAILSGPQAGNYTLKASQASVTITKASPAVTLSPSLLVHVTSPTAGLPRGTVNLLDGANFFATAPLSASGDAAFSPANLSLGTHSFTAAYSGDADFFAALSAPALLSIGPSTTEDFSLAATSAISVSVPSGTAAAFAFSAFPVNGALSSPILLSASGLPVGATASFNPALLPPGNTAFVLTVQTVKQAQLNLPRDTAPLFLAVLLPLVFFSKRGRRPRALLLALIATFTLGCGDRVNSVPNAASSAHSYTITVTGTATSSTGATLLHSANITLILQ